MLWTAPFTSFAAQVNRAAFVPPADVTVSDGDMVLTMDLPGLTAADLQIELVDGYLSVQGERKRPELAEGTTWAHSERAFGRFERRVKLPDGVDPDKVMATMDDGVLSLIVPKPERMVPKTITVGSSSGAPSEEHRLETATA